MQDRKECFITGATENLHKHHIYGGGRRSASEHYGCWIYLREDWHNLSSYGVHFNHDLDRKLKAACQREFEKTYTRESFIGIFGRNYIEDDEEEREEDNSFEMMDETIPVYTKW